MEMFGRSRRQLAFAYALIMCLFMIIIILVMHMAMNWSIFSEQAQELSDAANGVAETQIFYLNNPNADVDENRYYKSVNDRLFFYIFNENKQLMRFERASYRLEPFVQDVIENWSIDDDKVEVFQHTNETGQLSTVMMMSKKIIIGESTQTLYVGKDVTALYSGLRKATYAQVVLGFIALLIASAIGYHMAGRALIPLKEAYEKQKQFAADASHELRTPLAVLLSSSELLLADPSIQNPFLRQVLEDVKSEVKKMTNLVSDLLMVARSDNNALKVKIQKLDLSAILEQVVRTMKPIAEKKNIRLAGENFGKVMINADEQKIKQLAIILVDNAIKYTLEGGTVLVELERVDDKRIAFSVMDSGIGIAAEDLDKVFERFYRVDKARSREMGGNGLGLAIAAEIVKLHDGKISVASKLGEGTKFTVELKVNLKK
ncbi:MAG: sensor histidine kinase [Selenomonadaceae bacterium]|nr:sensor histidine kinase [Selenomonadaceae bacterium]